MREFLKKIKIYALIQSQRAATAVEYGLICAFIVLAMLVALQSFATKGVGMWTNVANAVSNN